MKANKLSKTIDRHHLEDNTFWSAHAESLKTSGLSRAAYCRKNNVNRDRFKYWLKKKIVGPSSLVAVKLKSIDELPTQHVLCTLSVGNQWQLKIHDVQAFSCLLEKMGATGC
jgi:hypothetical protein